MRITTPQQMSIKRIANSLGINIHYGCVNFIIDNDIVIRETTKQREWQLFGHELGHYLRHAGNQYVMCYLFRDLQEYQADHFAYHFCVPTFMLDNVQPLTVHDVVNLFCVEYQFARQRLDMYQQREEYI
ncbi:hypothetical protein GCM10028778_22610 [Barrientosiimonas marina]|uniref:ImmA/IrrE family metallo-endopeptidase n=1 Tax=Lentibacillus kimchii TaxID=1542911 RepID=A0ABW2UUF5_9BACI